MPGRIGRIEKLALRLAHDAMDQARTTLVMSRELARATSCMKALRSRGASG